MRGLVHDASRTEQARRNGAEEVVVADLTDLGSPQVVVVVDRAGGPGRLWVMARGSR